MWRKVLQHCKINFKKIIGIVFVLTGIGTLYSQTVNMPEMPEFPQMPDMPSVGGGFYRPAVPEYKGKEKSKTNSSSTKEFQDKGIKGSSDAVLSENTTSQDFVESLIKNSSILTANDISSLYDAGLFNNISSLNKTAISSSSSDVLLKQILSKLEELKEEKKNASAVQAESLENRQKDNLTFKTRNPSILRFNINGYSIIESLEKVFFSETEADGSFLLTGDRKYFVNQKTYKETFYFLFRTIKSNGSVTTYEVIPYISQDTKNDNSYIARMSREQSMIAEKTGNFVVLHYTKNNLKIDLLLDIDNK